MKVLTALTNLLCCALALTALAAPVDNVQIDTWRVPWPHSRPRDPAVAPSGKVWFVGQAGDYIAFFNPETERFKRYTLQPGAGPHNCIVAKDGTVWFSAQRGGYIGHLDPATGKIVKYTMPNPEVQDPHTLRFNSAGDIWFTLQRSNFIGKLNTSSGKVHLIEVPTENARPYGIVIDSEDRPWFAEFGSNKLGVVDPKSMTVTEIALPRKSARPRRLAITEGDRIWYVDYPQGYLGVYDPARNTFHEWRSPSGEDALPYGMVADGKSRIWYVETGPQPNRLIGFKPMTQKFFVNEEIPNSAGAVRNMTYADGEIWFGMDSNYLARVRVPGFNEHPVK